MSKKQKSRKALKASLENFSRALEQGSAVVYRRNFDVDQYEYLGDGIEDVTGYSAKEMNPKVWDEIVISVDLYSDLEGLTIDEAYHKVRCGEVDRWQADIQLLHRNGKRRWVQDMSTVLRDESGHAYGCLGIFQDITDRKNAAKQLAEFSEQLRARNEEMQKDMQMAHEIQVAFSTQSYPNFPGTSTAKNSALHFCHRYLPTATLAGDFFDVFPVSDTMAGVFICDVMGHGIRASLLTAYLRGVMEELLPIAQDPGAFLAKMNTGLISLLQQAGSAMFASACYCVIDLTKGEVRFTNAGHPPPIIFHSQTGKAERLIRPQSIQQPALGLINHFTYEAGSAKISQGDRILLFTDGVFEVENSEDQLFGEERLMQAVEQRKDQQAEELLDGLLSDVNNFSDIDEFLDDICMVSVDVRNLL